jgi:hypothetical protein
VPGSAGLVPKQTGMTPSSNPPTNGWLTSTKTLYKKNRILMELSKKLMGDIKTALEKEYGRKCTDTEVEKKQRL